MSKHSKKQFRALCGGISNALLSMNIKRNKVIVDDDGWINDELDLNNHFVVKYQEQNGGAISVSDMDKREKEAKEMKKNGKAPAKKKALPKKKESISPETKVDLTQSPAVDRKKPVAPPKTDTEYEPGNISQLEREKKEIELKKAKEDLEIKRIQKEKLMGEVIPSDLAKGIFTRHNKNITDQYYQSADLLLTEIATYFKASREEMARFKKRLVEVINEATLESLEISRAEINAVIKEYSQSRGVGQKKV